MTLNIDTGELILEGLNITPHTTKVSFFDLFKDKYSKCEINGIYESYNVQGLEDGDFTLTIYFKKEKITFISICLGEKHNFRPFEITAEESNAVKKVISSIGGENKYHWGEVIYSEDYKGGIISIIIKFNLEH